MHEHDGDDPHRELEPIDLDALFGDESDESAGDSVDGVADVAEPDEDDARLMGRLFAAYLADEPGRRASTADLVAAARSAAAGSAPLDDAAATDLIHPASGDRGVVDELAAQRRRRSWLSRGLLAAAAVAALAIGTTVALTSRNGSDTASSDSAAPAAGSAYSAAAGAPTTAGPPEQAHSDPASAESRAGGASGSSAAATAAATSGQRPIVDTPTESASRPADGGPAPQPAAPSSEASSGSQSSDNSDAAGACYLPGLSERAGAAAARALGADITSGATAVSCRVKLQGVAGSVVIADGGSRVTVLVFGDGATAMPFAEDGGAARRSVEVGDRRLRVVVSVAAQSSVTDRQLQQVATAVLATQR